MPSCLELSQCFAKTNPSATEEWAKSKGMSLFFVRSQEHRGVRIKAFWPEVVGFNPLLRIAMDCAEVYTEGGVGVEFDSTNCHWFTKRSRD